MALQICKQHLHPPALPPSPPPNKQNQKAHLTTGWERWTQVPTPSFWEKMQDSRVQCSPGLLDLKESSLSLSPPTLFFPLSSWLQMDPSPALIFFFFFGSGSPPSLPGPVSGMIHCSQLRELICRGAEIRSAQALCRYNQKTSAQAAGSSFPIQGNNIIGRKEQKKHTHT